MGDLFYVLGVVAIIGGAVSCAAAQGGSPSGVIGAVGGIVAGIVFIGMGYGLKMLSAIHDDIQYTNALLKHQADLMATIAESNRVQAVWLATLATASQAQHESVPCPGGGSA
jgi:hypothetical protein